MKLTNIKQTINIQAKIKRHIRNLAIQKTESRIILAKRSIEEFSDDELEILVKEEEDKIKSDYKFKSLLTVMTLLGISIIG